MPGRGFSGCILALIALVSGSAFGGEAKTYAPPPDTPVIPWTSFSIQYAVRVVGNAGPAKVVFYITKDNGATWELYGEDPDLKSPMNVTVPGEGTYGFITAIATQDRPAVSPRPGTRPDRFIIVDRTPPQARWITPAPGQMSVNNDGSLTLAWEASDPHMGSAPVNLEYSTDNGGTWLPLRNNLPAKGSINWNPPLMQGQSEVMLRLAVKDLAGNTALLRNRAQFNLDRDPPQVSITGPASAASNSFNVEYTAQDPSGVAQVELFYTTNDGADWYYAGQDPDRTSPYQIQTPPARRVGLYLTAVDQRGNRRPAPVKGTRPMFNVEVDKDAPQVNILYPFTSASLVIDQSRPTVVQWSAADMNIRDNSAKIEYSRDGGTSWNLLADGQPVNGSWNWTPGFKGENLLLRVAVADRMGNLGYGTSAPFRVDDRRPDTSIVGVKPTSPAGGITAPEMAVPTSPADTTPSTNWKPVVPSDLEIPGAVDSNANPMDTKPIAEPATNPVSTVTNPTEAATAATTTTGTPTTATTTNETDPFAIPPMAGTTAPADTHTTTATPPVLPGEAGKPANMTLPPADATTGMVPTPPVAPTTGAATTPPVATTPAAAGTIPSPTDIGAIPDIPPISDGGVGNPEAMTPAGGTPAGTVPTPPAPVQPTVARVPEAAQDTGQMLNQADQLYADGAKYDEAEKLVRQVLMKEPNNPRAYALLSSVLTEKGKFEDAIASADHAMQLAPGETRYLLVSGYAQYTMASSIFSDIAAQKVPDSQVPNFTAQVVQALAKSEQSYMQALSARDPAEAKEANYRLGQIEYFRATKLARDPALQSQGLRKAIAFYEKAYGVGKPDYREVLQLGICYYRLEEFDKAEQWLEKAQEVSTEARPPKEAIFYLAMIQEKLGRFQQALPFWEKVAQQYEEGSKYREIAESRIKALKRQLNP